MGQAAVDLPDPLQQPSAAGAKNADDLLSQLAGDEIDRLLATADDAAPPTADDAQATTIDEAGATGVVHLPEPTADTATESPADTAGSTSAVDLDAVLATAAALPSTTQAEKAALVATKSHAEDPNHAPPIDLGNSRLPLIFRPLEWISAPLDPWPDQLRDALGKVGLLTLVNALAVLAYVLLFRRHH